MEIINEDKQQNTNAEERVSLSRSVYNFGGVVMIVCGLVWLGSNYNLLSPKVIDTLLSWQMLLVAIGGWLLCAKNYISGGALTTLGVLLVVVDYFDIYISFERLVLPLLLVVAGIVTICTKGMGSK